MKGFEDYVGQDKIKKGLQKAILNNKVSHAYIFDGQKGMGKLDMANLFAKTLQCKEKGISPCNTCQSCIQFETGNHPDIKYITSSKKTIGVNEIRIQIEKDILERPYYYQRKIYIIPNGENLTEQAQNALLKTIEEPPSYGLIFIITNNINMFLPTILSRCMLIKFRPYSLSEMEILIKKKYPSASSEEIKMIASFSEGNPQKAKEFLETSLIQEIRKTCFSLLERLQKGTSSDVFSLVDELEKKQKEVDYLLEFMITWYRDLILIKALGEKANIFHIDQKEKLFIECRKVSYNSLQEKVRAIQETKRSLKQNANFQLAMQVLFIKLKENEYG